MNKLFYLMLVSIFISVENTAIYVVKVNGEYMRKSR